MRDLTDGLLVGRTVVGDEAKLPVTGGKGQQYLKITSR